MTGRCEVGRKKKVQDPTTEAVLDAEKVKKSRAEIAVAEMKHEEAEREKREQLIAESSHLFGRVAAANYFEKVSKKINLTWLKEAKEKKIYRDIPGVKTWKAFCNHLGYSRNQIDRRLRDLDALGEGLVSIMDDLQIPYRNRKQLRLAANSGDITIKGTTIFFGDEQIPCDEDHVEDLNDAIKAMVEKRNKELIQEVKEEKKGRKSAQEQLDESDAEKDVLNKELKRLRVFDADEDILAEAKEIEKAAGDFAIMCRKFVIDDRLDDDIHMQAKVQGALAMATLSLRELRELWDDRFDDYEDIPDGFGVDGLTGTPDDD